MGVRGKRVLTEYTLGWRMGVRNLSRGGEYG